MSDLSEEMRTILLDGTAQVTARLAEAIEAGIADGSLRISGDTPLQTAMEVTKRQFL